MYYIYIYIYIYIIHTYIGPGTYLLKPHDRCPTRIYHLVRRADDSSNDSTYSNDGTNSNIDNPDTNAISNDNTYD